MATMDEIVSLAKRRGFVYPTSEIYGGLANAYDYGPVGAALLRNIRNLWWREFIDKRLDMVGLDSAIILHPQTWVASGHVESLTDPLTEDLVTHKRYRLDHLIEAHDKNLDVSAMTFPQMVQYAKDNNLKSPEGNELSEPKMFNLLFETSLGAVSGEKSVAYLRGETAQGIFSDFKNIVATNRVKLPFGVGQIGKSFRNEITLGQFVFRTMEFEQAEIEYFFDPEKTGWESLLDSWKADMEKFIVGTLGVKKDNVRWRRHTDTERSHYSKDTWDLDYNFPFGWKELWGVAYRTDYDLSAHQKHSGVDLSYVDGDGKKLIPHVIEPAVGVNRLFLMVLSDAFTKEEGSDRVVLRLSPAIAPYQVNVSPLLANKEALVEGARKVFESLVEKGFRVSWDDRGNIGKRYAAADEIGTPYCVVYDFESEEGKGVTVRSRDTGEQRRVNIDELTQMVASEKINF